MNITFDRFEDALPESVWADAVIAGGYAVNPALAGDIDIWLPVGVIRWHQARAAVLQHLIDIGAPDALVGDEGGYGESQHLIASFPEAFDGKTVQVLISDLDGPQALVDSFDISTHAVAMSLDGMERHYARDYTVPDAPPRILRWSTPASTLNRVQKISSRYGSVVQTEDMERLVRLVNAA